MNLGEKVIYQIYPKSFYDSNGDGIGDLRGIIQKIPYIQSLNIDMIWFNPFYVSPQKDNGYDIANYYEIDPLFGTMEDFEELVQKLKEINVEVMLDMVFNHCSTDHEWFQRALAGEKKYQDYFYLRPAKPDGSLPTNWQSKFGGPAWEPFGDTDLYYLHLYDKSQADLDWHNPNVRHEMQNIVNFWLDKGVKGFRFDVLNVIGKDEILIDSINPTQEKSLYTDTPIVHEYIQELNEATFGKEKDSITVGEMSSTTISNSIQYTRPDRHELSMVFSFHHLKVDYKDGEKWTKTPFDFLALKDLFIEWQTKMDEGNGWQALFWNNHDQPRSLNRFGDPVHYHIESATMLATAIHGLRGTPYIYMGEEIGMIDPSYQSMDDYVDVEAINAYEELCKTIPKEEAFSIIATKARDNSRIPMSWDDTDNAGFSKGTPWLSPSNQKEINVEKEQQEGKIFNYYQQLIQLRKTEILLSQGHFQAHLKEHPSVFAYERYLESEKEILFVVNQFYGKTTTIEIPKKFQGKKGHILLSNYEVADISVIPEKITLQPYQSYIFKIEK